MFALLSCVYFLEFKLLIEFIVLCLLGIVSVHHCLLNSISIVLGLRISFDI